MSHVSFFQGFLPPQFHFSKNAEKDGNQLLLTITSQAIKVFKKGKLSELDALIKNWGCQITTLEVLELFQDHELADILPDQLKVLKDYSTGDLEVDPRIIRLGRFHLLKIVNDNKEEDGIEKPFTNIKNLQKFTKLGIKTLKGLVDAIQIDESLKAAVYIEYKATHLPHDLPRSALLQRVMVEQERKVQKQIVSHSCLHNTEVVFRVFQGILVIINKLTQCTKPIPQAKPMCLYMKMPEKQILDENEVAQLEKKTPLFVVEGYVKVDSTSELAARIKAIDLIELINIDSAVSRIDHEPMPNDIEAQEDIIQYASNKEPLETIFQPDHFYATTKGRLL